MESHPTGWKGILLGGKPSYWAERHPTGRKGILLGGKASSAEKVYVCDVQIGKERLFDIMKGI